jgi:hypothetical protein
MCAVHRCFSACIDRKPVLSVVADLVNSETSSQARSLQCSPGARPISRCSTVWQRLETIPRETRGFFIRRLSIRQCMRAGTICHGCSASRWRNGSRRIRSSGPLCRTFASHRMKRRIPPAPRQSGENRALGSTSPPRRYGEWVIGLLWPLASPLGPAVPGLALSRMSPMSWSELGPVRG